MKSHFIAVDFGAGSGRVILGILNNDKLTLNEVHRFENKMIEKNNHLYWDLDYLFNELITGLSKIDEKIKKEILSIGIDTWGVDYAFIDEDGEIIDNPFAYRDSRTNGIMKEVFNIIPKRKIYEHTGIQFLQFNTIFQLYSELKFNKEQIEKAKSFLFMPDVFNYFLTGKQLSEYTIASTSQLINAESKNWDEEIIKDLQLPIQIFPQIVQPGKIIGLLKEDIQKSTGLSNVDIIAVGAHDTASAVAAVPAIENSNWAYLSSGTWSLLGVEVKEPVINDISFNDTFTNEGGIEGTIRYLKNTMGLWIFEQTIKSWEKVGYKKDYNQLFKQAAETQPFRSIINPDDITFLNPNDMPAAIKNYCERTNQKVPVSKGEFVRCILESLALKYKFILEKINEQLKEPVKVLHIIGGGSQNEMLNQFTADATGIKVVAGPVEATAIGNILMQAIAKNKIKNLAEGRNIVGNSFRLKIFQPLKTKNWEKVYKSVKILFV